jgi:hypothetical protein
MALKDQQTQIITQGFNPAPVVPGGGIALILNSLKVIDVSVPTAPTVASTTAGIPPVGGVSGACEYIDTSLHLLYVISGIIPPPDTNILQVVDVSNKAAPAVLGTCAATYADSEYRVAKIGNTLYAAGDDLFSAAPNKNLLQVFNVANPAAPAQLTTYNLKTGFALDNSIASEAVSQGNNLFISGSDPVGGRGFFGIYNASNPLALTQTSLTETANTGLANDVFCNLFDIVGNYLFLMLNTVSLARVEVQAWNISNPAAPTLAAGSKAVLATADTLRFSQLANNHCYGVTISADHNIYPVDCTDPLALVALAPTLVTGTRANFSIRANGSKVYLAKLANTFPQKELRVFDATVPAALVQQGVVNYSTGGSSQQLHLDI